MPPTRSSSKRAPSRERSVEKALPSLNELFPEDLFRGSFAQPPQQPSASFTPLSVARADSQSHTPAARPRSPADPHPASRGGRRSPATIATRSHPHPQPSPQALRGSTTIASTPPPPADYSTPPSTADAALQHQQHVRSWRPPPGTDREPERPVDLGHPSRYAHPSRGAHRDALGPLSLAPAPRGNTFAGPSYGMPPSSASPSHIPRTIQSPADELVSILTRSGGLDSAGADSRTHMHGRREPARHMPYGPGPSMAPALIPTHAPYYPHAHAHAGRPGPSTGGAPAANVAAGHGKARYPQQHSAAAAVAGAGAGGARGKANANAADDSERRHCCPHCNKRFNRPSSLAIHVNTHTGAKPFTCAFPGCNRKFNVNSNMRRHYRNHLTSRRRDVVARMVQPPSPSSSVPHGALGTATHPHMSLSPDLRNAASSMRGGSIPASIADSGSPSVSRSSSYSPSPGSSRSPSPMPSPISAVTSPFPPTPRSLPSTSFRGSPARYASQHQLQPYYQHHQSYSQPPAAPAMYPVAKQSSVRTIGAGHERECDGDAVMRPPSPQWSASEYEADDLEAPAAQAESYVRGDRPVTQRVSSERQTAYLWERDRGRPRAESSPDMRRARPYPSPHDAPEQSDEDDDDDDVREDVESERCDVPGCDCAPGRKGVGTPRLRPAFQDTRVHPSVAGWTVLEGASEDG